MTDGVCARALQLAEWYGRLSARLDPDTMEDICAFLDLPARHCSLLALEDVLSALAARARMP